MLQNKNVVARDPHKLTCQMVQIFRMQVTCLPLSLNVSWELKNELWFHK